ncbi:hypothetical protein [Empedobacter sp.]|uniref:hypothetical protein n=1 Tax=Empedobacter sp. TaxID=1927715 RepID=UPI0028A7D7DA|nr:hypothetical protein [Empedobacter sp.]
MKKNIILITLSITLLNSCSSNTDTTHSQEQLSNTPISESRLKDDLNQHVFEKIEIDSVTITSEKEKKVDQNPIINLKFEGTYFFNQEVILPNNSFFVEYSGTYSYDDVFKTKYKKGDRGLFVGYATYIFKDNKWQLAKNEQNEPIISIQRAVKKIS